MTHEVSEPDTSPKVGRRDALSTFGFWIATVASMVILGIPGVRFAMGKSLDVQPEQWVPLGSPDKLPSADFSSVAYQVRGKDAWREVKKEGLIYVQTVGSGGYLALSAVCTHLGCNVRWSKATAHFACPCHQGVYDSKGAVISGPPPRPLRELETRLDENGLLEARL